MSVTAIHGLGIDGELRDRRGRARADRQLRHRVLLAGRHRSAVRLVHELPRVRRARGAPAGVRRPGRDQQPGGAGGRAGRSRGPGHGLVRCTRRRSTTSEHRPGPKRWTRLEQLGEDAHVIAGGQSLVPMMMLRMAAPTALVDVGGACERTIEVRDGTLELSALVRHVDLEHSDTVAAACPMLTEAVRHIGNVRVRQRGTIGGSLAHAEATSELACVTLAHRGSVQVLGPGGERTVDAADLFITHLMTTLDHAEVITAVRLPALTGRQGSCFLEMARRAGRLRDGRGGRDRRARRRRPVYGGEAGAGGGRRQGDRRLRRRPGARRWRAHRGGDRPGRPRGGR